MRGGAKRVLISMAVIVGMHVVVGALVSLYAQRIAGSESEPLMATLRFGNPLFLAITLGSFFIGGLILGLMQERVILGEPILAALGAMLVTSLAVLAGAPETIFLVSFARVGAWMSLLVTIAVGVVATVAGALIGERLRTPAEETPLVRASIATGLGLVIIGPFLLLMPYGLPWYIVVIAILVVLVLVGVAYYLFVEGPTFEQEVSEISISPERKE
ncbi:hypothetical protein HRbin10_00978 [bacterium HR10]|nr:hypothetical protein HRbin10_00978 [bacterium HR10]